jgi:hypothetical protein
MNGPVLTVSQLEGSLPDRVGALLSSLPVERGEHVFALDDLSLQLGMPLPDFARNASFWQRGDLGRAVRRHGYIVQVRYGEVIFIGEGTFGGA